ncbi:ribosomal protein L24e-domain-containing protein [Tribonema minus]|uniref:Ribosomal protein L24e-domain-containing protein n=1 Tax=Tribonema minus TaxID=303371 RepID=A0A836CJ11_9STRA|nr:ribosomal protein L24e-domain-containing protein [Tribonema minus]
MVIKTDVCAFSEFRIYPGHGMRFIRKDGTPVVFINAKCKSLLMQRKKPAKLTWTQSWRRLNKKIKVEEVTRRRNRRTTKFQRAIVGASLDEIKAKRAAVPKKTPAQLAALKEIKDRKAAAAAAQKATAKAARAEQRKEKPAASRQPGASKPMRAGNLR